MKNNFDFLRLLFASFVIITHSYSLLGLNDCDWLCVLSRNQATFSSTGVKGFFIISGYLIYQSLQRSDSIIIYYWKRVLRLFPALIAMLVILMFIIPFLYISETPFYQNKEYWSFFLNNLKIYQPQFFIHGVFERNPYPLCINGSLWTIQYELTMYILLSFLLIFKKYKKINAYIIFFVGILLLTGNLFYKDYIDIYAYILGAGLLFELGYFFMSGVILYAFEEKLKPYFKYLFFISILVIIFSFNCNFFNKAIFFTLPIIVIHIGSNSTKYLSQLSKKIGDLSYGIYIYGFPIQQIIVYYFNPNLYLLMISSIIIAFIFGYLSWHLIEKKCLKLKSKLK